MTTKLNSLTGSSTLFPLIGFSVLIMILSVSCKPIQEFHRFKDYDGIPPVNKSELNFIPGQLNVAIVADTAGTEIFDLFAPFFLFNATNTANVNVVASSYSPITMMKGVSILPHITYEEYSSALGRPDVIVIPNLSTMEENEIDTEIIDWIISNVDSTTYVLSVCDGSLTAAKTGIYDGKMITTHASDIRMLQNKFKEPVWTNDRTVTKDGKLYSTAGVSNAVEGSLMLIGDILGEGVMYELMEEINYPHEELLINKSGKRILFGDKLSIMLKTMFKKNERIIIPLYEGVSEFTLAAVLDTYYRTFPLTLETVSADQEYVTSEYGLTILPTKDLTVEDLVNKGNETYINKAWSNNGLFTFNRESETQVEARNTYVFDYLLSSIDNKHGEQFGGVVRKLLDYRH